MQSVVRTAGYVPAGSDTGGGKRSNLRYFTTSPRLISRDTIV